MDYQPMILPLLAALSTPTFEDAPARSNDISVVGTHTSYKQAMAPETMAKVRSVDPRMADALDYAHRSLAEQRDAGARQLEIDVNYDPGGGHYAPSGAVTRCNPVRCPAGCVDAELERGK